MASFTLNAIREEAERRYGSLVIEDGPNGPIKLRAALRLPDKDLAALQALSKDLQGLSKDLDNNEENSESIEDLARSRDIITDILAITSDSEADWREYSTQLDRGELLCVYEVWAGASQEGEA